MPGNTTRRGSRAGIPTNARGLFQIGKYWIDYRNPAEPIGPFYRHWYDDRRGGNRRKSLGTTDLEEAKEELAAIVLDGEHEDARDPEKVLLLAVLSHYQQHHVPTLRNKNMADRACELISDFVTADPKLGNKCKVSQFTWAQQSEFITSCRAEHEFSVGYLTRIMGVLSAAYNFAYTPVMITNVDGDRSEVSLLKFVPPVLTGQKRISKLVNAPEAAPISALTIEQLADFLDSIEAESTFRYCIIALNTWARPEAVTDLRVSAQVDFAAARINMLPPGKRQTKKRRPLLRLPENLAGWLRAWDSDAPIQWRGKAVTNSRKGFEKAYWRAALKSLGYTDKQIRRVIQDPARRKAALAKAHAGGYPHIIRYDLRHFMATRVREIVLQDGQRVPREQRQIWLGHAATDITSTYEHLDPDYLKECAEATDALMRQLHAAAKRDILPPAMRSDAAGKGNLEVIEGGRG